MSYLAESASTASYLSNLLNNFGFYRLINWGSDIDRSVVAIIGAMAAADIAEQLLPRQQQ
jgi:hypothetical protein